MLLILHFDVRLCRVPWGCVPKDLFDNFFGIIVSWFCLKFGQKVVSWNYLPSRESFTIKNYSLPQDILIHSTLYCVCVFYNTGCLSKMYILFYSR